MFFEKRLCTQSMAALELLQVAEQEISSSTLITFMNLIQVNMLFLSKNWMNRNILKEILKN